MGLSYISLYHVDIHFYGNFYGPHKISNPSFPIFGNPAQTSCLSWDESHGKICVTEGEGWK